MPTVKELPWIVTAESLMFTNEVPGSGNNPRIMHWARGVGGWVAKEYSADSIPWCGLFAAHCMRANGIPLEIDNPLSALAWNQFGLKTEPCYGAVIVFRRTGGGHVGFYMSEDEDTFHVLGGNQSDSVNITRVAKDRWVGCRWPKGYESLKVPGRIRRTFDGQISKNEA
jgi:uncharacterized protein (TIGR02594 family)